MPQRYVIPEELKLLAEDPKEEKKTRPSKINGRSVSVADKRRKVEQESLRQKKQRI